MLLMENTWFYIIIVIIDSFNSYYSVARAICMAQYIAIRKESFA